MPAVDEILADLASHPPTAPTPVGEIRGRARRRVRRRRALAAVAATLVVAAAGVGVGAAVTADDPGEEVAADGGGETDEQPSTSATSAPPDTEGPVVTEPPSMTLDPPSGHVDGMVVEMSLDEPAAGPAVVAQCAAEAGGLGEATPNGMAWCTGITAAQAEDLQPFTLSRVIRTPNGDVDCAEAEGRCVLGVRVGGLESTDDRLAPLAFAEVGPPTEPVVDVDGDEGVVLDGDTLLITVTGVETGDLIQVQQCRTDGTVADDVVERGEGCDDARWRTTSVEDGPETQLTFTAFHDVYLDTVDDEAYEPGWTRCEPCELVVHVGDALTPTVRLPLAFEATDAPIRPEVALDPGGPYTWGQRVTVRATGLQPHGSVPLGWCPVVPPQGGGGSACWSGGAEEPIVHTVGADGAVVVEDFALPQPDSFVGTDCAVPGACGVGLDGGDFVSILAITPIDLTG